jgi:3-hydroxyisobutyrate dehydrogenase-like beta-hydroxyacid dehydrogenase
MIAVVGLGSIGIAMAERLVNRTREVVGIDFAADRREIWKQTTGLEAVSSLDEVDWTDVDHVLVIVRLTNQVESVLQSLTTMPVPAGAGVVIASTLDADYARDLHRFDDREWRLIEMPVSGGEDGARSGSLTLMPAGRHDERDTEFFGDLGATTVPFGEFGQPTIAKLLNNVSAAYTAMSYAEIILLAAKLGMKPARITEILHTSSGGSWMGDHFMVLSDDLLAKDVDLLRARLGDLPDLTLNGAGGIVARLEEARALLVDDEPLTRPVR